METVIKYTKILKETNKSKVILLGADYKNASLCLPLSKIPNTNYNKAKNIVKVDEGFFLWLLKQNNINFD